MKRQDEFWKATMSFCFASLGNIFRYSLMFLLILFNGCTYESIQLPWGPHPEVKSFDFHPMYFCSGDEITVTWDTQDIDKLELRTNSGELKLSTVWPSGTLSTPPIDRSMLPLRVKAYFGDRVYRAMMRFQYPLHCARCSPITMR
jgi:hypothetical protein